MESDEVDEGLAAARDGLTRLCLATREVKPVEEMIRYVVAPDGRIVPDLDRKLPGRGAWVTAKRAALAAAMREKGFARAFRGKGQAGADLPDRDARAAGGQRDQDSGCGSRGDDGPGDLAGHAP